MRLLLQLMMMTVLLVGSTPAATRKVSDAMLRNLYLSSGRFEDIAQRMTDQKYHVQVVHDPVIFDSRPVRIPAFPSNLTFLFMVSEYDKLIRLEIASFSEDIVGDIKVMRYCIPNISKYTMATFDSDILQTLKFEELQNCCEGTLKEIERNVIFGSWPDCHYFNYEKPGQYQSLNTCSSFCFFSSLDAPQTSNPAPYVLNITKRYPLSVFSDMLGDISDTWNPCT